MHGVGDAVHEVHHAEEPYEAPALKLRIEKQVHDHRRCDDTYHEPRLEFAPAGAGALDDVAHDGVVERVEHACADHYRAYCRKLRRGERAGEQHIGEQIAGDKVIHHVAANCAEREHYKVFLSLYDIFFHSLLSVHSNFPR